MPTNCHSPMTNVVSSPASSSRSATSRAPGEPLRRRRAIALCQRRFADDPAKSFFLYDGTCFTDSAGVFTADLAVSLDVVYHLTEDVVFETYLRHLFAAGRRLVVIYSTNMEISDTAPHVRHRRFTSWVAANCPEWTLTEVTRGPNTEYARADFFVYQRA